MSGIVSPPLHPLKDQPDTPSLLSQHYAPSVFEKYTASVTVGNKEVTLNLYDTAGECTRAHVSLWSSPRFPLPSGAFPS